MSGALRHLAETTRAKYARTFRVKAEDVKIEWSEGVGSNEDDATISAPGHPVWTLGAGERGWHHR